MFKRKKSNEIDIEQINETVDLFNKILKIFFFVLIIVGIMVVSYILKEWKIIKIFLTILDILTPFFIGFFIAWLFNPLVTKLSKKIKRGYSTFIVYVGFLILLVLFVVYCIPTMISQLNDFVKIVPKLQKSLNLVVENGLDNISSIIAIDIETIKDQVYDLLINIGSDLTTDLPSKVISLATSIVSGFGTFLIGLVIGIYMLHDFDGISNHVLSFLPKKVKSDVSFLLNETNKALVSYIQGNLIISLIITLITYFAFLIIGIKAPLLFAFFCGITNIIPYIGPYIGGVPVALVGFSQSFYGGIFVIIAIVIAQSVDGYILRPILLGRGMNLHPVTIIIALLIFGHFFGIIGMLLSMPIVAIIKIIFGYYDEKYDFFNRREVIDNNE